MRNKFVPNYYLSDRWYRQNGMEPPGRVDRRGRYIPQHRADDTEKMMNRIKYMILFIVTPIIFVAVCVLGEK